MAGTKLLPCPFCGGKAKIAHDVTCGYETFWAHCLECHSQANYGHTEAEAIEEWNKRAAYEMDGFFYLPKPKEPIVEVIETTNTWDGTKVRTDLFYQVQNQAIVNWAKELDEHIIKRICEVWDTRAERTCRMTDRGECSECGAYIVRAWTEVHDFNGDMKRIDLRSHNYCPNCGARVVEE